MPKCKINNPTCVYHACMSPDCQKHEMIKHNTTFGKGKCYYKIKSFRHVLFKLSKSKILRGHLKFLFAGIDLFKLFYTQYESYKSKKNENTKQSLHPRTSPKA